MLTLCQHHQQYLDSGDDADAGGAIRGTILHQHRHHPTPGVSLRALASPARGDLGCQASQQPGPRILGFLGLLGPGLPPEGQAGFEGPEQQARPSPARPARLDFAVGTPRDIRASFPVILFGVQAVFNRENCLHTQYSDSQEHKQYMTVFYQGET